MTTQLHTARHGTSKAVLLTVFGLLLWWLS